MKESGMVPAVGPLEPPGSSRGVLKIVLGALIAALALLVSGASAGPTQAQDVQPNIVGGDPVPDGKYPFMASLYDLSGTPPSGEPSRSTHFCGGTLIDSDSILTAAHCLGSRTPSRIGVVTTIPMITT